MTTLRDDLRHLRAVQAGWAFGVPEDARDQWLDHVTAAITARTATLTPAQARYLSVLAAHDLRHDADNGRTPANSTVIRDIHTPAWQALQPACHWDNPDT